MIKNNFLQRLILTIVAIPAIVSIVVLANWYNNVVICAIITLLSIAGSLELGNMLFSKRKAGLAILSSLQIVAGFFESFYFKNYNITLLSAMAAILIIFSCEIFKKSGNNFEKAISDVPKKIFVVIYPSFMLSFIPNILNRFESGNILFLFMLFLIFANDSFCYVGGKMFGKNNKGYIKVSPNKSIAGFISGFLFTFAIGYLYMYMYKNIFENLLSCVWMFAILSFCVSLIANIGDLAESLLKRSAGIKDSGNAVLGRGGIMDSIDSIVMVSPFFYFALLLLQSLNIIK